MPSQPFYQNYTQVVLGIEACLDKKLQIPALILIYTLIDSFAWSVYGESEKSSRRRFEMWTKGWVLSHTSLGCTPADLYAARCGVLHTMTSESSMTQTGQARKVIYAWGTANAEKLQSVVASLGQDFVAVDLDVLFLAVREGMARVMEKMELDLELQQRLKEAAAKHFTNLDMDTVDRFLSIVNSDANK